MVKSSFRTSRLLAIAVVAWPVALQAQKGSGRLLGLVIDAHTRQGLGQAVIVQTADGRTVTTDTAGLFDFDSLPAGIVRFTVRAKGFPVTRVVVALTAGEYMERRIELDSTVATAMANAAAGVASPGSQPLPKVNIEAKPSLGPRFANFERRRATGAGHYIVREDIEKGQFSSLQDAVRGVRGVSLDCGGGRGCVIHMVRAPMRCTPEYIVDDTVDNFFGPNIPVRDIEALEIYTGPADVPGEYAGRNAGCGVIVIWTRSGPPKTKKKS